MSYEMAQHLTFIIQGCFSIWLLIDGTSIIGFGRKVLKNQRQTNTPMSCILISHLSSLITHLSSLFSSRATSIHTICRPYQHPVLIVFFQFTLLQGTFFI